jgi:hypothetical protein
MSTIGCSLRAGGLALRWRWTRQLERERDEARELRDIARRAQQKIQDDADHAIRRECKRTEAAKAHASHWRRDVAALLGVQAEGTTDSDLLAQLKARLDDARPGTDLADRVRAAAWTPMSFGNELGDWMALPPRRCRVCGCTDDKACVDLQGACYWAAEDLCSLCARRMAARGAYDLDGDLFPPSGRLAPDGVVEAEVLDAEAVWTLSTGWACGACGTSIADGPCVEHQPRAHAVTAP